MRTIRFRPWLVALALSSACGKSEGGSEAGSNAVAAAHHQPLIGHEFLRMTDAQPGMLVDRFPGERLEFAIDELENYYLGVGSRVLVVERAAAKPEVRVIELAARLELLGIHGDDLILFGACPAAKLDSTCTGVFRRPVASEGQLEFVTAFPGAPVLVGDRVVALADEQLVSVALDTGEVLRAHFEGAHGDDKLDVHGDRVVWETVHIPIVYKPELGHGVIETGAYSFVYRSRAPFDEAELVFRLEGDTQTEVLLDLAWIGEGIAYLVLEPRGRYQKPVKLYRRIGEQTELLLTGLWAATTRLVNDSSGAWLVDTKPGREQLWRIGPEQHRRVVFIATPELVTATRWGLVWVEDHEGVLSFRLAGEGPPGLEAPELPARLLEPPTR